VLTDLFWSLEVRDWQRTRSALSPPPTEFATSERSAPSLHKDFLRCPRHKGTPRRFECTRLITVDHVKQVIRRIPDFAAREKAAKAKAK